MVHVPIRKGRDGHIPTLFGANFSEVAFLHPVVKLTNSNYTLGTFVSVSEKGKCCGVVTRDLHNNQWGRTGSHVHLCLLCCFLL